MQNKKNVQIPSLFHFQISYLATFSLKTTKIYKDLEPTSRRLRLELEKVCIFFVFHLKLSRDFLEMKTQKIYKDFEVYLEKVIGGV